MPFFSSIFCFNLKVPLLLKVFPPETPTKKKLPTAIELPGLMDNLPRNCQQSSINSPSIWNKLLPSSWSSPSKPTMNIDNIEPVVKLLLCFLFCTYSSFNRTQYHQPQKLHQRLHRRRYPKSFLQTLPQ